MRAIIAAVSVVVVLLVSACAGQSKDEHVPDKAVSDIERYTATGYRFLIGRSAQRAIDDFDQAITLCEAKYNDKEKKFYASRGVEETLFYMMLAASDKKDAVAVDTLCSDAYYLRGYASLDLGQVELAKSYVEKAVDMAPANAIYLSELGHIYQVKRDYESAYRYFLKAEEAAEKYSPKSEQKRELTRSKRGLGFSLIELGRLDDAEKKFRECLVIDPNDKGARHELEYIKTLRKSGG